MDSWFDNPIKLLDALGKCTEDYLYIWNIEENRVWFSEAVAQRYALGDGEFSYCTKEAILKITHPNDHKLLKQWVREIAFVESDKVPDAQWRWIDKNGKAIWLSVKGQMQVEKAKRQHLVIGTLSDAALKSKVDFLTGRVNKSDRSHVVL